MRGAVKGAIVGGVFLAMAGGAGYGLYGLLESEVPGGGSAGTAERRSGPPSEEEVADTARKFLAAWAAGDAAAAAALTDNPSAARDAVADYRGAAHIVRAEITPGAATGATVPFTVRAEVAYGGAAKEFTYRSRLSVVRGVTSRDPLVDWQPSVLHPELRRGERLRGGEPAAPAVEAVDRHGKPLTPERYPSLRPLLERLRETYGATAGGRPGAELWIEPASAELPKRTLVTLAKGEPARIATVLDAKVQAAAEAAVAKFPESSVVAVKPSTGEILAVANHRADGFNAAMEGRRAPGSTMKIVTAAMLMDRGAASASAPAQCVKEAEWGGRTFHNLGNRELPGVNFATAFAQSCNTAFIKRIDTVDEDEALSREAHEVFGIGMDWKTGVVSQDGSVPEATGAAAAAAYIGQGEITMNPLNMASVTATAKSGVFRQPVLVPAGLDDRPLATASRTMKPAVARQLRDMMRLTATSGTGARAMASVGGDKGAKTGSAEVDGAGSPDSWFTGFSDDVAAAAMVEGGGHGADAAGPVVAAVLRAG
ncbi:penicillin-binding transpeptidase domain-containing protein [Streptomyces sp. NPDC002073]